MKQFLIIFFIGLSSFSFGQSKYGYVHFDKLIEVKGTEYVIASIENRGKVFDVKEKKLLFINTVNGEAKQIDFDKDAYIREVKQIKIDSLGINLIILSARTIDLNGKKGIDWEDPMQIIILSTDGKERTQLTEDKFFAGDWTVNAQTGKLVVTGYYDTNNNNKHDKADKNEILIYDLKTLKLTSRI